MVVTVFDHEHRRSLNTTSNAPVNVDFCEYVFLKEARDSFVRHLVIFLFLFSYFLFSILKGTQLWAINIERLSGWTLWAVSRGGRHNSKSITHEFDILCLSWTTNSMHTLDFVPIERSMTTFQLGRSLSDCDCNSICLIDRFLFKFKKEFLHSNYCLLFNVIEIKTGYFSELLLNENYMNDDQF